MTSNGTVYFSNSPVAPGGTPAIGPIAVDLTPRIKSQGTSSLPIAMFGSDHASLSNIFVHFRVGSIKAYYTGTVGTATYGTLAFAYLSDPVQSSSVGTFQDISDIDGSITTDLWGRNVPLTIFKNLDREWKYLVSPQPQTQSDVRMMNAGSISVASFGFSNIVGNLPASVGSLRFEGTMEYNTLAPVSNLVALQPLPSASNSPSQVIELIELDSNAAAATPLGSTPSNQPSYQKVELGGAGLVFTSTSFSLKSGSFAPFSVYDVYIYWSNVVGTVVAGATLSSGSGNSNVTAVTNSTIAPFAVQCQLLVGNDNSINCTINIGGLTGMTAGNINLSMVQIR